MERKGKGEEHLHVLECQSAWSGIGQRSDKEGEETKADALGAICRWPYLRRPDERRSVDELERDDVQEKEH